jgi:hypothetical protein
MKRLFILAATFGGLTMAAITSQAQTAATAGSVASDSTLSFGSYDQNGNFTRKDITVHHDAVEPVAATSGVYTHAGEDPKWAKYQTDPKAQAPATADNSYNHDGTAFRGLPQHVNNYEVPTVDDSKVADESKRNIRSGKWKRFVNGEDSKYQLLFKIDATIK